MSGYLRPSVAAATFLDADGRPIPYGERWGSGMPPEQLYSVTTHPERFAPLHEVAAALIEHLVAAFDVRAEDDPACAADLQQPGDDVVRAARLTPAAEIGRAHV